MTTSPTTSLEPRVRGALLDVLHAQWRELGVPLQAPPFKHLLEVIDPESLLWCSFHFFGSEPRVEEAVRSWYAANRSRINMQRLNTLARRNQDDPLESPRIAAWKSLNGPRRLVTRKNIGVIASSPASLHVRSRDVLGNDCAAYLIVALLGSPRGVRCRDIATATGYTYRCIADTATSWSNAGLVRFEHGFCTILDPTPWLQIFHCNASEIVTVDWHAAYDAVINFLHTLERAKTANLDDTNPLLTAAAAKANLALQRAAAGITPDRAPAIEALRTAIRPS